MQKPHSLLIKGNFANGTIQLTCGYDMGVIDFDHAVPPSGSG